MNNLTPPVANPPLHPNWNIAHYTEADNSALMKALQLLADATDRLQTKGGYNKTIKIVLAAEKAVMWVFQAEDQAIEARAAASRS